VSCTASINENQADNITANDTQLTSLQRDSLAELGEEGHVAVKDGFIGRSFGVFTSGGDAQGTK
jgi:hypothetical protein